MTPPLPVTASPPDADVALRSDAAPELRLTAYLYEQVFDHRATLVTAAAGGLTLFGGPGDRYALSIPLKWGATLGAAPRTDGMVDLRSGSQAGMQLTRPLGSLGTADLPPWAVHPLAVVTSASAAGHPLGGMSLLVGTALPEGAGMQSDVALTSVMSAALAHLFGVEWSLEQRAGLGDLPAQMASVSCPDDMAMLVDTWRMTAELVPFDLVGAGLRLMIIDLGETVGSAPTGVADLALTAADHIRAGDLTGLGPLFGQATDIGDGPDRGCDPVVLAAAACAAGALGVGTLPGGCLMALVPVDLLRPVRSAVAAAWPAARVPKFLTAVSSRGGRALTG